MIKEDKVFCLFGNVGTPTTVAIKPLLINEKVPLFGPFTGAEALRSPVSRYLLHFRASYNQEVESFVEGAVDVLGYRKIAVFYQNDAYGMAVLDAAKAALKKRDLEPKATGTYTRNLEDVTRAFNDIMDSRPQAVVMAGTYSACAKFIVMWKRQYYLKGQQKDMNPVFMNVSFVGPDRLADLLDKYGSRVVVTQVVPPFEGAGTNYPAIADYTAALSRYFPKEKPNFVSLEGYLAAKVFVEILKQAGKDPTRESFIAAAESMKNFDIQAGNVISYSADNHQGSQKVYPTLLQKGSFQLITDWNVLREDHTAGEQMKYSGLISPRTVQ
jgi:ABC-type branched-subunit amino acid transport system substrate-binding protein